MYNLDQASIAGTIIQATGAVEFDDGLRTGVLQGGAGAHIVATIPWSLLWQGLRSQL